MSYFSEAVVVLPSHERNPNTAIRKADRNPCIREKIHSQSADLRATLKENGN